jgi:putative (di)nucleoside polyphosphate hydrolase
MGENLAREKYRIGAGFGAAAFAESGEVMHADLPYRPGVGIMLLNARGEVFVAKRIDTTSEAWQMPQGGIDAGEDPLAAAKRELYEETSVTQTTLLGESREWIAYDLPEHLIPKLWGGQYRGQTQKWFAMRLDAADSHINIETAHPEFSEWRWAALETLPDVIVPFKREMYARLVEEFRDVATSL